MGLLRRALSCAVRRNLACRQANLAKLLAPLSLLLEEKVAEAAQGGAKADEVDTCTNPARDLNQMVNNQKRLRRFNLNRRKAISPAKRISPAAGRFHSPQANFT